jgi:hypothetical protein
MPAMQTKSQRAKLRSIAAKKGWATRRLDADLRYLEAQRLACELNTKLLSPPPVQDPNPWRRLFAWIRRMVGVK